MAAKKLLFGQDARDSLRRGVDALADAVKVTRHQDLRRESARLRRPAQGDVAGHGRAHRRPGDRRRGRIEPGKSRAGTPRLILTVDCMIANAPKKESPAAHGMGEQPEMY